MPIRLLSGLEGAVTVLGLVLDRRGDVLTRRIKNGLKGVMRRAVKC